MLDVFYRSTYGATQQYATWCADKLGLTAHGVPSVATSSLTHEASAALLFTPIYYGRFNAKDIAQAFTKAGKPIAVAVVGASPPEGRQSAVSASLPDDLAQQVPIFHLRGRLQWERLGFVHRMVMRGIAKKSDGKIVYGKPFDFMDEESLEPVVQWAREHTSA